MMKPNHLLLLVAICLSTAAVGQFGLGAQGGPLFFKGVFPEPSAALSNTSGFAAGLQFTEGHKGESGFRIGLDYVERAYHLYAQNINRMEDLTVRSSLLWFSSEMRWPVSKRVGLFFDLGPVIGFEFKEQRSGESWDGTVGEYHADLMTIPDEVETGFGIRDARWRMGFSLDVPIGGNWLVTTGAHLCPGIGNWARGNNYATLDGQLRAGLMRRFGNKRKHG
jgi:hypothetical protein